MRRSEGRLAIAPGIDLPMTSWRPAGHADAVMIGLHGYGDFRLAFEEVGPWLARRGIAFHAYDQRGFGEAPGHGLWPGRRALARDLCAAIKALSGDEATSVFVIGESLGGGVALAATQLAGGRVDGLILVEPAVRNGVRLRPVWDLVFGGLARVRPGLRRALSRGHNPLLTAAARRRLGDDPRIVRHIRADAYKGLLALADAASESARRLRLPTLLLYGRADGVIPARLLERAERDMAPYVTALRYPTAPHLLLQAEGWQTVLADVVAWMDGAALPTPGSPALLRWSGPRPKARHI
jgi:alpha-beta hydrolase superfamily lysophospholipase